MGDNPGVKSGRAEKRSQSREWRNAESEGGGNYCSYKQTCMRCHVSCIRCHAAIYECDAICKISMSRI